MKKTIHRPEYDALLQLLRAKRVDAGMTQVELSDALGVRQSFVSDVERGVRRLDVLELREICMTLGQDLGEFIIALETEIAPMAAASRRTRPHPRSRR